MAAEIQIGDRLKTLRKEAGMSQQQLAEKSGLSMSLISQIEQGKTADPKLSTMLALARALDVSLDRLASQED